VDKQCDLINIFVSGLHRSGTTSIANALASADNAGGFLNTASLKDEGQRLQSYVPTDQAYGGIGRFVQNFTRKHIPSESFIDMRQQWVDDHSYAFDKDYFVEKSPVNFLYIRELSKAFPRSHFVIVVRHPIAVVLASMKWLRISPMAAMHNYTVFREELNSLKSSRESISISEVCFESINSKILEKKLSNNGLDLKKISSLNLNNSSYEELFQKCLSYSPPLFDLSSKQENINSLDNMINKSLMRFGRSTYRIEDEISQIMTVYKDKIQAWGYSVTSLDIVK
jgi:hypothetical protein